MVHALKIWRCYLEGTKFVVVTDHKPNTFLGTQPHLSRRQVGWSEFLQQFDFEWQYRPGRVNVADHLSRHPGFSVVAAVLTRSHPKGSRRSKRARQRPPASDHVDQITPSESQEDTYACIAQGYERDPWFTQANIASQYLELVDNLYYKGSALVLPDIPLRFEVMSACHDSVWSGHFGVAKTLELVARDYWWPKMRKTIGDFVRGCSSCQHVKSRNTAPGGQLCPMPIPSQRWTSVSMDWITCLPPSSL